MDEEIRSIEKNNTWNLVSLPKHKTIGVKWVYKTKKNFKGEIERYKTRRVAKGYNQKVGIDYDEVFALVACLETIRLILSLPMQRKWRIHQLDVKSVFLNGVLEEEVYIEQPLGYHMLIVFIVLHAYYGNISSLDYMKSIIHLTCTKQLTVFCNLTCVLFLDAHAHLYFASAIDILYYNCFLHRIIFEISTPASFSYFYFLLPDV